MSDEVLSLVLSYGCECLLQQSSDFIFQALVSYEVVFFINDITKDILWLVTPEDGDTAKMNLPGFIS